MSGARSFHAGRVAEDRVAEHYRRAGHQIVERRWRGCGGEIDLIIRDEARLVFVEVKASRSHTQAAERILPRQVARIQSAAAEYIEREPNGQNTEVRFDVALMDSSGVIEILENAFL